MINQSAEGRGRRAPYNSRGRGEYSNRGRGQRQPGSSGETRAQFGQQEPSLGQAVFSDSPSPGLTEPGKTLQGVVVALLDSYGFIRQAGVSSYSMHLTAFSPVTVHSKTPLPRLDLQAPRWSVTDILSRQRGARHPQAIR